MKNLLYIFPIFFICLSCKKKKDAVIIPPMEMSCKVNDTLVIFNNAIGEKNLVYSSMGTIVPCHSVIGSNQNCSTKIIYSGTASAFSDTPWMIFYGQTINIGLYQCFVSRNTIEGINLYSGSFAFKGVYNGDSIFVTEGKFKNVRGN